MTDEPRPVVAPEQFLALAERVLEVLEQHQLDALVVGGFALAVHNYPRATEDLDLGVATDPRTLPAIRDDLEALGYRALLRKPDGNDPLGGVIDIEDDNGALVQVVNFDNPPSSGFPGVIDDALRELGPRTGSSKLRAIPLPYLIAMKLYAGGPKAASDIHGLLRANPGADLEAIRALCAKYRLRTHGFF